MAAAALSGERRRGSAGWLVIRAVPRPVILLGWFAAFVLLVVVGLLPAAALVWLTVVGPASEFRRSMAVPGADDRCVGRGHGSRGDRPVAGCAAHPLAGRAADPAARRHAPARRRAGGGAAALRCPGPGGRPGDPWRSAQSGAARWPTRCAPAAARWWSLPWRWSWPSPHWDAPTCERSADPAPAPRRGLGGAGGRLAGRVPRRRGAHGGGHRPAGDRGRLRWLGQPGPRLVDRERVPAGLHRGHAAGRPRRRPVGRSPPVRGCAGPVLRRQPGSRAEPPGRSRRGPGLADRVAGGAGLRRRRHGAAVDGARQPPLRRPLPCRRPGPGGSGDLHRHGDRAGVRCVGAAQLQPAAARRGPGLVAVDLLPERAGRDHHAAAHLRRGRRGGDAAHARSHRPGRRTADHAWRWFRGSGR